MKMFRNAKVAFVALFLVGVMTIAPLSASAQSYYYSTPPVYNPQGSYESQYAYMVYLMQLVAQLQAMYGGGNNNGGGYTNWKSEISIETEDSSDEDNDEARLNGSVDFNNSDYAYVWFEWGNDRNDLDEETTHIKLDDNDDEDFSARITDLDEDDTYYFRAVGEDDNGNVVYGSVEDFSIDGDDDDNDDEDNPSVETGDADDITDDSAEISGEVDMNDFENGLVFFVYGEDEDMISDVEDDNDTYEDIDQDGLDLRKYRVDSDLDGQDDYTYQISETLEEDTEYFFSICVEYEDEDDDETLACGDVESFETDN